METRKRYSQEVKERAVRLLRDHEGDYESEWQAMRSIASKIGCTAETLRKWVRPCEIDKGIAKWPDDVGTSAVEGIGARESRA